MNCINADNFNITVTLNLKLPETCDSKSFNEKASNNNESKFIVGFNENYELQAKKVDGRKKRKKTLAEEKLENPKKRKITNKVLF